eukprot:CAMPEP_0178383354 /NCGR_PEP_ID=MMETSP0689_2-20121128/6959_1 /TAXON_ID=160604 /ORGANISM="Amphidinium massartii, Strain CS-259" /LENGTH=120 /DNA_ID=CAMNT_0020003573 /DNA_START=57 /DNA_END=415 /DNA_ORIENTATION=+
MASEAMLQESCIQPRFEAWQRRSSWTSFLACSAHVLDDDHKGHQLHSSRSSSFYQECPGGIEDCERFIACTPGPASMRRCNIMGGGEPQGRDLYGPSCDDQKDGRCHAYSKQDNKEGRLT